MKFYYLIMAIVSFLVVFFLTPWLIKFLRKINLVVKDMNKKDTPLVPVSGGMAVMVGLFAGLMVFIFFRTFIPNGDGGLDPRSLMLVFAATTTIIIITLVGFVDDLLIRKDFKSSTGLKQWQKPLLTLGAAIPLMVVGAGYSKIAIPFFGVVDFGLLYPLVLIPLGVVGAANMVNLLGGFNGVEGGMGLVYMGMLGIYTYVNGRTIASIIACVAFFSLLAFYYFNKDPAKVLPGDSLTYFLGGTLACVAILGNIERAAIIVSIPFFIEFILKARKKFKAHSYGYYKDGKIQSFYKKVYSIPHFFTRTGRFTEKQITYFCIFIELVFSSLIWVI